MENSNHTSNRNLQSPYAALFLNLSIGLIGFIFNISVCLIISTHSVLRQPFNYLILNLSFTDLLISSAVILNGVSEYLSISYLISYRASGIICYINLGLVVVSLPAACLTLLIISLERYQAIVLARFHNVRLSTISKVIPIIWLLAIITAIIPVAYAKVDLDYPYECAIGKIDHYHILILLLVSYTITGFLPIAIMMIVYTILLYKLIRNLSVVHSISSLVIGRQENHLRRAILPVLFISIISATSIIPHLVLYYYTVINQYYSPSHWEPFTQQYYKLWHATAILYILTSIVDPLLYNLASSQFRRVLHSLIRNCCRLVVHRTVPVRRSIIKRADTPIQTKVEI